MCIQSIVVRRCVTVIWNCSNLIDYGIAHKPIRAYIMVILDAVSSNVIPTRVQY